MLNIIKPITDWNVPPRTGKRGKPAKHPQRWVLCHKNNRYIVAKEYQNQKSPVFKDSTTDLANILEFVSKSTGIDITTVTKALEGAEFPVFTG